jgi:hypothetical protein
VNHVFAHEHNYLVELLQRVEKLTAVEAGKCARLIVVALMAKIHTTEWTPQVFHSEDMDLIMNANWTGMIPSYQAHQKQTPSPFTAVISGLTRMSETNNYGIHRAFTEEFVSVYRMHALLPDVVQHSNGHEVPIDVLMGPSLRHNTAEVPVEELTRMMFQTTCGRLDLHNFPVVLSDSKPFNLAVVDIVRDREIGVPRYAAFRRMLGLAPPATFEECTNDPADQALLRQVYDTVEDVDLQVGMMAESKRKGWMVSQTAFHVFILEASRRIASDRFLCRDFTPEVYTKTGYDWVCSQSMRDLVNRHLPHEPGKTSLFFAR